MSCETQPRNCKGGLRAFFGQPVMVIPQTPTRVLDDCFFVQVVEMRALLVPFSGLPQGHLLKHAKSMPK